MPNLPAYISTFIRLAAIFQFRPARSQDSSTSGYKMGNLMSDATKDTEAKKVEEDDEPDDW